MTSKFITIIGAMLLALLANTGHSNAGTSHVATWAHVGDWTIAGNSKTGACIASAQYDTQQSLGILFAENDVHLIIRGVQAKQGDSYNLVIEASTGDNGIMEAIALDDQTIIFTDINEVGVKALVNARTISIKGVGSFELKGSKAAMASAWECYEALNQSY